MKKIYPPIGFHGDKHLLKLVDYLASKVSVFVETGANIGATLNYVARTYPHLKCLSCEPDKLQFLRTRNNVSKFEKVAVYNMLSQDFFPSLQKNHRHIFSQKTLFWLDAHGRGFQWPLRYEIRYITRNFRNSFILIDDFKVPNSPQFQFDRYGGQHCSYDFIRKQICGNVKFKLYYPNYTEHTSKYHPLVGWGLIELFSKASTQVENNLSKIVKVGDV